MKRILLIVLLVVFLGTCSWLFWKFFFEYKEFNIVNSYKKLGDIQEISLSDLYTGRLERFLNREFEKGRIESFAQDAVPLSRYEVNSVNYEQNGIVFAALVYDDIKNGVYLYSRNYPYKLAAVYKLNISGRMHYLSVYEWLNSDRSVSFTPIIIPERFVLNDDPEYKKFLADDSGLFLSPIIKIRDMKSCEPLYFASKESCEWSVGNKLIISILEGNWNKKKIPQNAARVPYIFTLSNTNYLNLNE